MLKQTLVVFVGGGLGALLRWRLSAFNAGASLPLGTLAANLVGCLCLGVVLGVLRPGSLAFLFLAAGLCGALTTFSTFAFELVSVRPGVSAVVYAALSLVGGVLAVLAGMRVGRMLA